ncbi:MAG: hypothetical protein JWO81_1941 [Alphaproteobacteria bacterium]|nr:hypothetical protein [Alphaproteobacteria bacterium]
MLSLAVNRRLAIVAGIVLPLAEIARRSANLGAWWLWLDDWLIGGALLMAAWLAGARPPLGPRALAGAWGLASGMGYYSFVGHVLAWRDRDVSALPGWVLAAAVGLGWLVALYALISAVAAPER